MMDTQEVKKALFRACEEHIDKRITAIQHRLLSIEESRNEETKSSAGDKYETGRAMMQMEEDKVNRQLAEVLLLRKNLTEIEIEKPNASIGPGSLVKTDQGYFFLSVGIGKITLGNDFYYCISCEAPIGRLLLGKKQGDEIVFNGQKRKIESFY